MSRLVGQVLRFGVVGLLAFAIDYGLLMLLSQGCGMGAVPAAALSFCVSVAFNYSASMRFVFAHREGMRRSQELTIFLALSVVGLGINELIMWIGTTLLGSSALAVTCTKGVATGIVMVWNFLSRKRWLDAGDA